MTDSIKNAVIETKRRREIQEEYNNTHGTIPQTIVKPIGEAFVLSKEIDSSDSSDKVDIKKMSIKERDRLLKDMEKANPQTINFDEIQKAKDILQDIEKYKKDNKPFYEIQGKPVIERTVIYPESSKKNNLRNMLIVAFGSLFVFIFIAFLLNAIRNIKEDPEASKKIKDAWVNGK